MARVALLQTRPYCNGEKRPAHPVTGLLADYCAELVDGTLEPRWNREHTKLGPISERWYSPAEVADLVGRPVSWVYAHLQRGSLGAKPKGSFRWLIRGDRLMAFLDGRTDVGPLPTVVEQKESR